MTAEADRRRARYAEQIDSAQETLGRALAEASDRMGVYLGAAVTEFQAAEAAARADYWSSKLAEQDAPNGSGQQVLFGPGITAEQPAVKGDQ